MKQARKKINKTKLKNKRTKHKNQTIGRQHELSQKPALYLSTSVAEEYIYLKHTLQFRETTQSYSITTYLLHVINKTNFWNSNFCNYCQ